MGTVIIIIVVIIEIFIESVGNDFSSVGFGDSSWKGLRAMLTLLYGKREERWDIHIRY